MYHFPSSLRSLCCLLLGSAVLGLSGCGIGVTAGDAVQANVPSPMLQGQLNGGQNPIVGATISVYEVGTGGYGSSATLKASVTTDSQGRFSFPSGAYTCTQSDTPTYLLSTGGDTGSGTNVNATLGAALGTCTQGKTAPFITLNEVTTVALAYSLSHYFNTTLGGTSPTNDNFGGPSTTSGGVTQYAKGIVLGTQSMYPLIATNVSGFATPSSGNITTEEQKIYYMANILAACVNSAGQTSTTDTTSSCGRLFNFTTPPGASVRPSDTLQAAVVMALYPTQYVNNLFLIPGSKVAFGTTLATTPADWSLSASFTSSSFGLGVDTNTLSTIDIDSSNRVWFPSNASGKVGIAYFDPSSQSFSSLYNSTGMVHPEQIAIDQNGYAWVSDTQGSGASAYNTASPASGIKLPLANTVSYAVTVAPDSSVRYSVYDSSVSKYRLATAPSTSGSLTELTSPAFSTGYVPLSLTFDNAGTLGLVQYSSAVPRFFHSQLTSANVYTSNVDFANDFAGQYVWNGVNMVGVRTYNNVSGSAVDGYCVNASGSGTCYAVKGGTNYTGASGMAADGAKTLWTAYTVKASVAAAPLYSGTNYGQTVGSAQQVAINTYNKNSSNGNLLSNPVGVGVDNGGNVWVSNAGCTTTSCSPGSFTLTVLIGAAAPTITPVAAQIAGGASLAGTQPNY